MMYIGVMASNDGYEDDFNPLQHPVEVKEETVEITCNEPCGSTETNTEDNVDEFIKMRTYDEVVSSIEIIKQLQEANKIDEECSKNERNIKEENYFLDTLCHPEGCLENQDWSGPLNDDSDSNCQNTEEKNCNQASNVLVLSKSSNLFPFISSDEHITTESSSFTYNQFESINHVKEEASESTGHLVSVPVYSNNYQEFGDTSFPSTLQNTSKYSKIKPYTDAYISLAKTAYVDCGSSNYNIKDEVSEVNGRLNEVETIREQLLIEEEIKGILDDRNGESKLCNDSDKPKYCQEKRRMEASGNPRKRSASEDICSLETQANTHSSVKACECPLCHRKTSSPFNLKKHAIAHTMQKQHSCKICGSTFSRKDHLTSHVQRHTGVKPFKCEICNYKCVDSSHLTVHMRIHKGNKPFECEICKFKSAYKCSIKLHMQTHTREKSFECEICGCTSSYSNALKQHMRIHNKEKPFKCEVCGYKSSYSNSLKLHIRTHSGEKPFECEICKHKSANKTSLNQHIRTHTGEKPYECEICSSKFARRYVLKAHMRTHTGEKPYKCEICEYKSAQSSAMKIHMKTHSEQDYSIKWAVKKFANATC